MAKMIGKLTKVKACPYMCCSLPRTVSTIKHNEETQWKAEAAEEMAHGTFCGDYFCPECGGDDEDYYDASELDGVPGVWTNAERLI